MARSIITILHIDSLEHVSRGLSLPGILISCTFPGNELVILNYSKRSVLSKARKGQVSAATLLGSSSLPDSEILTSLSASSGPTSAFNHRSMYLLCVVLLMYLNIGFVYDHLRRASLLRATIILDDRIRATILLLLLTCYCV